MYWGDYARDTGHLNACGHGAYLMLIKHYWCTGQPLADNDNELWRIACCDSKTEWLRVRDKITRLFSMEDGVLRHKRIDLELGKAVSITEHRRAAGKASAVQQALQRTRNTCSTSVATPVDVLLQQNDRPSQPPSQRKKESVLRTSAVGAVKEPDARDRLWAVGLPALQAMTGAPGPKARGMVGRLVKAARDDCALVLTVLQEAESVRPIDPFPWLMEAIMARTDRREGPAEQLARELDFSFDSLPRASDFDSEGNLIHGFAEPASDRHLLAYDAETRDPPDF